MKKCISHKSEKQFCQQFNAKFDNTLENQYKDIDAWITSKNRFEKELKWSVSIKSQEIAQRTGNFSFELVIENTRNGKWAYGNFMESQAHYSAITDGSEWFIFWTKDLKQFIQDNKELYPIKDISEWRQKDNRRQGRYFDNARNMLIPVEDLRKVACKVEKVKK